MRTKAVQARAAEALRTLEDPVADSAAPDVTAPQQPGLVESAAFPAALPAAAADDDDEQPGEAAGDLGEAAQEADDISVDVESEESGPSTAPLTGYSSLMQLMLQHLLEDVSIARSPTPDTQLSSHRHMPLLLLGGTAC